MRWIGPKTDKRKFLLVSADRNVTAELCVHLPPIAMIKIRVPKIYVGVLLLPATEKIIVIGVYPRIVPMEMSVQRIHVIPTPDVTVK